MQMLEDVCKYHMQDHSVVLDLKESIRDIIEGQNEMRSGLIALTEAFKNMDRLEVRLDKMEVERSRQEDKRDKEVEELRTFMNKALGIGAAVVAIMSIALKFIGV